MPDTMSTYDPTLYHEHFLTAILYAENSGFTVIGEGTSAVASREDMPDSLFTLTKQLKGWCWVRTT